MKKVFLICLATIGLSACATMEGRVSKTLGKRQALVALGKQKLVVGDKILLLQETCTERWHSKGGSMAGSCTKSPAGAGEVTEKGSDNSVVIKVQDGVALKQGQIVEKKIE